MDVINLKQKASLFKEQWSPKIIADLDNHIVCLAKFDGEFVWHAHDEQDELFLVVSGRFRMDFRDKQVWVEEGEMIVVPKGVEHRPYAPEECCALLIEDSGTAHTGGVDDPRKKDEHERI